jgi:hypothetical protein
MLSDPLLNLFDESDADDEVFENLQEHNDNPPYLESSVFGEYQSNHANIGENLQRVSMTATQAGAGQIASVPAFSALCGLVQVHITTNGDPGQVELLLDVATKGEAI